MDKDLQEPRLAVDPDKWAAHNMRPLAAEASDESATPEDSMQAARKAAEDRQKAAEEAEKKAKEKHYFLKTWRGESHNEYN